MVKHIELSISLIVSVLIGIISFIVLSFIVDNNALLYSIIAFSGSYVILYPYFCIHNRHMVKKYAEVEKTLTSPVFCVVNGNYNMGKKTVNGNVYFCDDEVYFASFDEKPLLTRNIDAKNIFRCEFEMFQVRIITKENEIITIRTPESEKVEEAMKKKGWIK